MSWLVGTLTVVSTLCGLLLGQITAGFEMFGVLIAAVVLMTLRV
jgi:hypothetical protein